MTRLAIAFYLGGALGALGVAMEEESAARQGTDSVCSPWRLLFVAAAWPVTLLIGAVDYVGDVVDQLFEGRHEHLP